jgi:hypothetical protein
VRVEDAHKADHTVCTVQPWLDIGNGGRPGTGGDQPGNVYSASRFASSAFM